MRGASGQGNTAKLMTENEKLLKDLKKVRIIAVISSRVCDKFNNFLAGVSFHLFWGFFLLGNGGG